MLKATNEYIKEVSFIMGDILGGSACRSCTESFCCEFQVEIGIAKSEFDAIEHLVTPEHIKRAKEALERNDQLNGMFVYQCPFLSEEGLCEIYDNRFLVCAIYSVVGDNTQCSKANTGEVAVVNPAGVIMNAATGNKEVEDRMRNHVSEHPTDVLKEFKRRYKL